MRDAQPDFAGDAAGLQQMAGLFIMASAFADAARCYEAALELAPRDTSVMQDLAGTHAALGDLERAEELLDRAIALKPNLYGAYQVRATLRRQTSAAHHVDAIRAALERSPPEGISALSYALAKELEDLGEFTKSFAALERGARARRAQMKYDVRGDIAVMERIAQTFSADWLRTRLGRGEDRRDPIFVMGLPRSGTTLTDRILSSHPAVESLGEPTEWATALMDLARPARTKEEVLARSAEIDPRTLGLRYLDRVQGYERKAPRFIDKTPINYLYLALIVVALPNASLVHVRRSPMDVCYALYKTPFQMAAPFSYDLEDLAAYYIAYDRLMRHWRAIAPGRFYEVIYEALVRDPPGESQRMLAHCGLDWDDACLRFERNAAPTATASAAQVREPIHQRSVGQWRAYERQLAPLSDRLRKAGIDVETGMP